MAEVVSAGRSRKSPLFSSTIKEGAESLLSYNRMLIPRGYGDREAEYQRLINGVSIWDAVVQRQVQLKGPDASILAQILCMRDLSSQKVGQGKYVALCDHRGVLINDPIALKISRSCYWFSIGNSDIWFSARCVVQDYTIERDTFTPNILPAHVDRYFADFMVRILTLCSGALWSPGKLKLGVCDPRALPPSVTKACDVRRVGLEGASFQFPARWLVQRSDGLARQTRLSDERIASSYLETFRSMLDLHIDKQGLTLDMFAGLTRQSASTLKSQLKKCGTMYQTELDKRRASKSILLLLGTDQMLGEIYSSVGYPDPPNFSRAFRRWISQTPLDCRKCSKNYQQSISSRD